MTHILKTFFIGTTIFVITIAALFSFHVYRTHAQLNEALSCGTAALSSVISGAFVIPDPTKVPIQDRAIEAKEFLLDCSVREAAQLVSENVVQATIQWVNTGFGGQPFYVQDLSQFFAGIEDAATQDFLSNQLPGSLNQPFQGAVSQRIAQSQSRPTLNQIYTCSGENIDQVFQGGASDSWLSFIDATTNPGCSPDAAYYTGESILAQQQQQSKKEYEQLLTQGEGTLPERDAAGNIVTPGAIINDLLKQNLGVGLDQLTQTDEIAELFDALVNRSFTIMSGGGSLFES
ncbi:hypothetical protein CL654_00990 [bacterium]|nr:hypothetical protein [bacterium]|tara:strand:- start:1666 stop:2532 length:867 start_codon:yes stop_codon:yes gene_type:complete